MQIQTYLQPHNTIHQRKFYSESGANLHSVQFHGESCLFWGKLDYLSKNQNRPMNLYKWHSIAHTNSHRSRVGKFRDRFLEPASWAWECVGENRFGCEMLITIVHEPDSSLTFYKHDEGNFTGAVANCMPHGHGSFVWKNCQHTWKMSKPLLEGLCSSNPCRFELSVFASVLSECLEMGSVVTRNMSHEGGVDCLVLPWVFWAWKFIVRAWKLQKSGPSPRLKSRTWKIRFSCLKAKSDKSGKVESDTSSLSLQNAKNVTGYSLHLI